MAFETFRPRSRVSFLGADEVGIGKAVLTLGHWYKRMGNPEGLALAFDRVARIIRLTPCPPHAGGYKVNAKARSLNPRRFYEHFGITETGRFRAVEKDGHVLIHLGPKVQVAA